MAIARTTALRALSSSASGVPGTAALALDASGSAGGTPRHVPIAQAPQSGGVAQVGYWYTGAPLLFRDRHPNGSGQIVAIQMVATDSTLVANVSSDSGATWNQVAIGAISNFGRVLGVAQDSHGIVHIVTLETDYHYRRLEFSYTGGAISGVASFSATGILVASPTAESTDPRVDIQAIYDASGAECLGLLTTMGNGSALYAYFQKTLSTTITSPSDFTALDGTPGRSTIADAPAGANGHEYTGTFAQLGSTRDLYISWGFTASEWSVTTLRHVRCQVSGPHTWSVGETITETEPRRYIGGSYGTRNVVWRTSLAVETGPHIDTFSADGTLTYDAIPSPVPYTGANLIGWSIISASPDDSTAFVMTSMAGGDDVYSIWDGSSWTTWKHPAALGDGFGLASCRGWDSGLAFAATDTASYTTYLGALFLEEAGTTCSASVALPTIGASASGLAELPATSGTLAASLPRTTAPAAGSVRVAATAAAATSKLTSDAKGAEVVLGTSAAAIPPATLSAESVETISAASASGLSPVVSTGSGIVAISDVSGATVAALDPPSASAAGTAAVMATGAAGVAGPSVAATASVWSAVVGTASGVLAPLAPLASAVELVAGVARALAASPTVSVEASAAGAGEVVGAAAMNLSDVVSSAAGLEALSGSGALALSSIAASASGTALGPSVTGRTSVAVPLLASDAAGAAPPPSVSGLAAVALPYVLPTAYGVTGVSGATDITLPGLAAYVRLSVRIEQPIAPERILKVTYATRVLTVTYGARTA